MSDPRICENFNKALAKLREFVAMPIENERDRAGVIQAFEFTSIKIGQSQNSGIMKTRKRDIKKSKQE